MPNRRLENCVKCMRCDRKIFKSNLYTYSAYIKDVVKYLKSKYRVYIGLPLLSVLFFKCCHNANFCLARDESCRRYVERMRESVLGVWECGRDRGKGKVQTAAVSTTEHSGLFFWEEA